jgi:hypothetical protein
VLLLECVDSMYIKIFFKFCALCVYVFKIIMFLRSKELLVHKADNLTAINEPIV